jgi:uncharacterized protein (DUF433 family)
METSGNPRREAVKMRRAPGIVFADGPAGRRAVIAGTGLDVWELVAAWLEGRRDFEDLRRNYEWLTEAQLRSALRYYELYPEEIDARLERERRWTPAAIRFEIK